MDSDLLTPQRELLSEEFVLVQAFKKTAEHLRYHNWYANTLEIDRAAVDLPRFIRRIADRLRSGGPWTNAPARLIFAPKAHPWGIPSDSWNWAPQRN